MTASCRHRHRMNGRTRAQPPPGISPSPPSDGGEGQGRGGPCSCSAPLPIAMLTTRLENTAPTRHPDRRPRTPTPRLRFGVRPVLGRSSLSSTESLPQFTKLLAYRCSNSRGADSLPSDFWRRRALSAVSPAASRPNTFRCTLLARPANLSAKASARRRKEHKGLTPKHSPNTVKHTKNTVKHTNPDTVETPVLIGENTANTVKTQ